MEGRSQKASPRLQQSFYAPKVHKKGFKNKFKKAKQGRKKHKKSRSPLMTPPLRKVSCLALKPEKVPKSKAQNPPIEG